MAFGQVGEVAVERGDPGPGHQRWDDRLFVTGATRLAPVRSLMKQLLGKI